VPVFVVPAKIRSVVTALVGATPAQFAPLLQSWLTEASPDQVKVTASTRETGHALNRTSIVVAETTGILLKIDKRDRGAVLITCMT